ncbi:MAG: sigma-54 dependent transcriptional regulator [Myxococcota bacterium]
MATVCVVDDHEPSALALAELLQDEGYRATAVFGAEAAIARLRDEPTDVLVTDLRMDGMDGVELLRAAHLVDPDLPVIVITGYATIARAVEATRAGAFAFVTKPLRPEEITVQVRNAAAQRTLRRSIASVGEARILGRSVQALGHADRAARTELTVLITGESGTGKELLARRIHDASSRRVRPFVAVNCGAIPETLIEAELFGASKGAFTGADRDRTGLVEAADGGTLFLDEVGELSLGAQVRLLRFLQEGTFRRVGETRERTSDVRTVAATHRDLRGGTFREDLFFRLAVLPIAIPPLRARGDDVLLLLGTALHRSCDRIGRRAPSFAPDALEALRAYGWPGNVRELLNLADRLAVLTDGPTVELAELPDEIGAVRREPDRIALPDGDFDLTGWLEALEERALKRALDRHDGIKARAAAALGLERNAFRYKLKKYGIEDP